MADTEGERRDADAIKDQLSRILRSSTFVQSGRLSRFLSYAVEETLAGRADRLNQYAIAIEVFDRDAEFDPAIDAIVRVEAGRLRSKLREYYDEEGKNDQIRIALAKRGYAITVQQRSAVANVAPSQDLDGGEIQIPTTSTEMSDREQQPSIAVLPFDNLSADPEQEYFADGISEDLITDLSKLSGLLVISRESAFSYKGTPIDVHRISEELGAKYILEGSVRRAGSRVRVNAQLIDGRSGNHLWAERYDREFGDIFEIQDEVNRNIVNALRIQLSSREDALLDRRPTDVIDAYDYVLRGMKEAAAYTREGSARARYCFESAIELDECFAAAYARLAYNHIFQWISGWSESRADTIDKGLELAQKAVDLDEQLALARTVLCWAWIWVENYEKAIVEGKTALELDPNDANVLERLSLATSWSGDPELALKYLDKASRLNPREPYNFPKGVAYFIMQDYAQAIELLQKGIALNPGFLPSQLYLGSSYGLSGQVSKAIEVVTEIKKISPNYHLAEGIHATFKNKLDRERYVEGLKVGGLT